MLDFKQSSFLVFTNRRNVHIPTRRIQYRNIVSNLERPRSNIVHRDTENNAIAIHSKQSPRNDAVVFDFGDHGEPDANFALLFASRAGFSLGLEPHHLGKASALCFTEPLHCPRRLSGIPKGVEHIRDLGQAEATSLANSFDDSQDHTSQAFGFAGPTGGRIQIICGFEILDGFFDFVQVLLHQRAVVVEVGQRGAGVRFASRLQ